MARPSEPTPLSGRDGGTGVSNQTSREIFPFVDLSSRFRLSKDQSTKFDKQYAHLYFTRLRQMYDRMKEVVNDRWGASLPVRKILEIKEGEQCVVIGTLFKDLKLRPNLIEAYAKDRRLQEALEDVRFASKSDTLIMEDEGARMSLAPAPDGVLPLGALCTGVVCAVRGVDLGEGSFVVSDMCFPGLPPQAPLPTLPPAQAPHVAIVSGLGISRSSSMLLVQHMVDWLAGFSGGEADRRVATSVCRVIVAGGLVSSQSGASGARVAASDPSFVKSLPEGRWAPSGGLDMFVDLQRRADATSRDRADASPSDKAGISNGGVEQGNEVGEGRRAQVADAQPVARGDLLIAELAGRVPVDVMPGRGDPTTASLPQQPMHRCLLPGLARMGGEGGAGGLRATNPYDAEVAGVRVMGTSGQNLHDLWRCTEVDSGIALAGASLAFSHLAPTAPDTLPCYPFSTADPFVIGECPHVLFAGDQPRFETALVEGPQGQRVRVIMVPRFDQTGQVVLVNLGSLETQLLQFDTDLGY